MLFSRPSLSAAARSASQAAEAILSEEKEDEPNELSEAQQAELDRLAASIASESSDVDENDWVLNEEDEEEAAESDQVPTQPARKKRSWNDRYQSVKEVPFEALPKVGCCCCHSPSLIVLTGA